MSSYPLIKLILFPGVVMEAVMFVVVAAVALVLDVVTFPVCLLL